VTAANETFAAGIYRGAAIAGGSLLAAMIVPRWFAGAGGGLEDAAGAAITFIVFATAGCVLSLTLFIRTVRGLGALPWPARLAGVAPLVGAAAMVRYVWAAL
jgi:hypothetical protein